MKEASALYRLLGDEARLRLLRVLDKDRFNVKELTGILGLAQSGVSRHLGLLKESELVVEERDGAFTFYRLVARRCATTARARCGRCCRRSSRRPRTSAAGQGRRVAAAGSAAAAPRELRARRPRHARRPAAGAGPQLGGVVARARACCCRRSRSPTSAAAKAISRSKPRAGRSTSPRVDRSTGVLARAKALAGAQEAVEHHVEEGRARSSCRSTTGVDRRRAAVAGAASRRRSGRRARRSRARPASRAAGC